MKRSVRLGLRSVLWPGLLIGSQTLHVLATPMPLSEEQAAAFYDQVLNAPAVYPEILGNTYSGCGALPAADNDLYKTTSQSNYSQDNWESRISLEPNYFEIPKHEGKVLLIDFAQDLNQQLAYRYLGNAHSHNTLYEPWSSSKVFAYTGAMASLRAQGIGATASIGNVSIADLITSIHSYAPTGFASDDSNGIATFFVNIAGRQALTDLFHDDWLKLADKRVRFRGAYGPEAFVPTEKQWKDGSQKQPLKVFPTAYEDPLYQEYRCETCGLTGNKPMTTLAQAEWLRRLATHSREPITSHPQLLQTDIDVLFFGDNGKGGMSAGISHMLLNSVANTLSDNRHSEMTSKQVIDQLTHGHWRIFQKIGWGPSETRGHSEVVVLAHVCLPLEGESREFTLAAQTSVKGIQPINVSAAGMKMQVLLDRVMASALKQ